ncbi:deoxyribodipyrimidine photo-lyase [Aestuariicella hydrocarbonica]|uniref:Deoxyribodipyrimidine photo-lyase n=1 Tax=Pseudomaricurvus hydrocarbonicus TaxID=1470433 RepID=A0A9E5MNF3_9GAMM|nr:deoxyribodipyrimidine photo-lyase [Aestuariicella hydrocarbonica]NHO67494.1 deoxyribodipyrimidine photo-lyase [Aestuariicella hydrocarbonica]
MSDSISIHWFRQDLRLADNPALTAAADSDQVLPVYILDDQHSGEFAPGEASQWWLHHSLASLNQSLNAKLNLYKGDPLTILIELCCRLNVTKVFWNRCYEPWQMSRDIQIKQLLNGAGIHAQSFNASLLSEPWTVLKNDNTPYKVFTPYYQRAYATAQPDSVALPAPASLNCLHDDRQSLPLDDLQLQPNVCWYGGLEKSWCPGEQGAQTALHGFLEHGLAHYKEGRDFPAQDNVSRLSPHLHFGEISPQQVWRHADKTVDGNNIEHFKRELMWREFSYYLLYHWPKLPRENLKSAFDHFPWQDNPAWLSLWQQGLTGYPLVDAGMRELWQTGFMHNRVRMVTASFLVKNLLIHWRHGAAWFWDCLVDADLASNSASWQWVAGCGTDASPYFRIFNPVTQGEKFDPDGAYTRRFVPELQHLPDKYLFKPWEAPAEVLENARVTLGEDYPMPVVDIKTSRQTALDALQASKDFQQEFAH